MKRFFTVLYFLLIAFLIFPLLTGNPFKKNNYNFYNFISSGMRIYPFSMFTQLDHITFLPIKTEIFYFKGKTKIFVWNSDELSFNVGIIRRSYYSTIFNLVGYKDNYSKIRDFEEYSHNGNTLENIEITTNTRYRLINNNQFDTKYFVKMAKIACPFGEIDNVNLSYIATYKEVMTNKLFVRNGPFQILECGNLND